MNETYCSVKEKAADWGLTPRLVQFPSWVRPRSVEPSEVQCVIIK